MTRISLGHFPFSVPFPILSPFLSLVSKRTFPASSSILSLASINPGHFPLPVPLPVRRDTQDTISLQDSLKMTALLYHWAPGRAQFSLFRPDVLKISTVKTRRRARDNPLPSAVPSQSDNFKMVNDLLNVFISIIPIGLCLRCVNAKGKQSL